jgi:hypothetical protein
MKPEPKKNRRLPMNNSPSARAKRMGVEGPKRSVAKPTASQSMAAKKKTMVKKVSSEGPKKSISKPSAMQSYMAKNPPRIVEAGVGNIPVSLARLGAAIVKSKTVTSPKLITRGPKKGEIKPPRQSKIGKKSGKTVTSQARSGVPDNYTGKTIGSSKSGETVPRTKASQKYEAKEKKGYAQNKKANSKKIGYM